MRKLAADGIDAEEEALLGKLAERVAKTEVELATYQQREGIFTKANILTNAKTMAPATWWATYGKHLPLISAVARSVLGQPCCASRQRRSANGPSTARSRRLRTARWGMLLLINASTATRRCT